MEKSSDRCNIHTFQYSQIAKGFDSCQLAKTAHAGIFATAIDTVFKKHFSANNRYIIILYNWNTCILYIVSSFNSESKKHFTNFFFRRCLTLPLVTSERYFVVGLYCKSAYVDRTDRKQTHHA